MYNRNSFISEAGTIGEHNKHSNVTPGGMKIARCTKVTELSQLDKQVVNSYYSFAC